MRPFLVAFVLFFALAVGRAAERAQQGTIPPYRLFRNAAVNRPHRTRRSRRTRPEQTVDGFDSIVRPFVTENCVPCHGYKKQKNGLNLESFESAASLTDEHERWAEVVKKLRAREMPPEEEPQPPEHQRQAVAGWLHEGAGSDRQADAARSRARDGSPLESDGVQQHRSAICLASTFTRPTTSRRTMPATGSTTSPTSCRCRPC